MADHPEIILYHYSFSPYARRVVWYLHLRKIPYLQCVQPPYLPRPTVTALGTTYRRIPLLSIGRDIYCDTHLILLKLAALYPPSPAHPAALTTPHGPFEKGIAGLFAANSVTTLFPLASALIPTDTALMKDANFIADREDYSGRSWKPRDVERKRPEALASVTAALTSLESTFFADKRTWILGGAQPSSADLEAVWGWHWLTTLKGALPENLSSEARFPGVWGWVRRWDELVRTAAKQAKEAGNGRKIEGSEALQRTREGPFFEADATLQVDTEDPLGLQSGELVDVWPTDTGFSHRDRGLLLKLAGGEIVIEKSMEGSDEVKVRIHSPRNGFRVVKVEREKL